MRNRSSLMPPPRPNILFIMPDQLRPDFLGCYGAGFIETPSIDALANDGVRYENCYSEHPVCVPARVSLMTGMNAVRAGVLDNRSFLRPDYRDCGLCTWPELLAGIGYRTAAIGKMHFYPWDARLGFQDRIVAEDKCWGFIEDDYWRFLADRGFGKMDIADVPDYHANFGALVSPHPWDCSVDHFVGSEAVRWIDEYDGEDPFALMVGFPGPHNPYDPSDDYATFRPEDMPEPRAAVPEDIVAMGRPRSRLPSEGPGNSWYGIDNNGEPTHDTFLLWRAFYAGLVAQIDREVGEIAAALRRKGILDDTVVIFASDHGDYLGDHGLSGKGTFYDSGCRVPLVVRHPGIPSGTRHDLVTLTDITASMLAIAGCDRPDYSDSLPLPGLGLADESQRDSIVSVLNSGWAIYDGEWKLCKYRGGSHLFNLPEDPDEQNNRARDAECRDVYERLDRQLSSTMMELLHDTFFPQHVTYSGDGAHSSSPLFGSGKWERQYPVSWRGSDGCPAHLLLGQKAPL